MARVKFEEYLEIKDETVFIDIDTNDENETFQINLTESWYSLDDVNTIIKTLNKAKRIYTTRVFKAGD